MPDLRRARDSQQFIRKNRCWTMVKKDHRSKPIPVLRPLTNNTGYMVLLLCNH